MPNAMNTANVIKQIYCVYEWSVFSSKSAQSEMIKRLAQISVRGRLRILHCQRTKKKINREPQNIFNLTVWRDLTLGSYI